MLPSGQQSNVTITPAIQPIPIEQGQILEAPYRIGAWLRRCRRRQMGHVMRPHTLAPRHSTMSNHQALVEALLMKSLLGYELVDTKFHLFSGRSAHPRKVTRLQALSANDIVLTARSEFFAELSSGTGSPDATFVDFDGGSAYEDGMALDDYGYDSDSDLEEEEEEEAIQTPDSDETAVLKGNTSESDDDDDDDLLFVADARSKSTQQMVIAS